MDSTLVAVLLSFGTVGGVVAIIAICLKISNKKEAKELAAIQQAAEKRIKVYNERKSIWKNLINEYITNISFCSAEEYKGLADILYDDKDFREHYIYHNIYRNSEALMQKVSGIIKRYLEIKNITTPLVKVEDICIDSLYINTADSKLILTTLCDKIYTEYKNEFVEHSLLEINFNDIDFIDADKDLTEHEVIEENNRVAAGSIGYGYYNNGKGNSWTMPVYSNIKTFGQQTIETKSGVLIIYLKTGENIKIPSSNVDVLNRYLNHVVFRK